MALDETASDMDEEKERAMDEDTADAVRKY